MQINFTSPETILPDTENRARSYLRSSGQNTGMWRTDRQRDRRTDGQISSGYGEQCGRAV